MPPDITVKPADPVIEAELDRLAVMPIAQLRIRYREVCRDEPPKAFGPDLLKRSIAHRIQGKAYGGLPRSLQRLLDQMVKAYTAKPGSKIALPRRIKPGSVFVRQWKGRTYRVMVQADGFAYDGKTFGNLSEIAVLITGTRWNGPRFFGLRCATQADGEPSPFARPNGAFRKAKVSSPRSSRLAGGSDYRKRNAALAAKSAAKGGQHGR